MKGVRGTGEKPKESGYPPTPGPWVDGRLLRSICKIRLSHVFRALLALKSWVILGYIAVPGHHELHWCFVLFCFLRKTSLGYSS